MNTEHIFGGEWTEKKSPNHPFKGLVLPARA